MADWSRYDVILLDCDGVIFEGNEAIPGSIEALNFLESKGKKLYFITNNSSKSRESNAVKLRGLGYDPRLEQIYSTSYVAPIYLKSKAPHIEHILVIGSSEFKEEFRKAGYRVTSASDVAELTVENIMTVRPDPSIQAVVSALSLSFSYVEGLYASICIQNGAAYYASNYDAFLPFKPFNLPGSGCVLAFIERASQTKATIIGKPEKYTFELIQDLDKLDKSRYLMVGDRLDTDILFGINSEIDTALVLTGATTFQEVQESGIKPTYIFGCLADLISQR